MALLKLAKNWLGTQWGTRSRNIDDASVPHGIDGPLSSCDISPVAKGWPLLPMRLYTLHLHQRTSLLNISQQFIDGPSSNLSTIPPLACWPLPTLCMLDRHLSRSQKKGWNLFKFWTGLVVLASLHPVMYSKRCKSGPCILLFTQDARCAKSFAAVRCILYRMLYVLEA